MISLITGASFGIGEACAYRLARDGYRVILAARSAEKLRRLETELNDQHGPDTALALPLDVVDAGAVHAAIRELPPDWQHIDVLINNAGLALNLVPVYENSVEEIDTMIDVNIKGVLYLIRAVVPGMLERGRGHIVNIGSTAGHELYPGGTIYSATKHAVLALTNGLKQDLHGTPLRVTAVSPGLTETDFSRVRFKGDEARAGAVYADTHALTAEEVADAVAYCVHAPESVNVQELLVMPRVQSPGIRVVRGEAARGL
ncbi:MAG: SDR family NAD(P)-dependent oxidoreductase [Rhodothermaceae bacterium]|nr:SDR family NAD(P)-dependent oxidoreductase [Rhodothermaceae bacterium]